MPAAPINWPEVEQLIRAGVGVRETARQLGLSEERVKRQATRKGWAAAAPSARLARINEQRQALANEAAAIVPGVPTAAEVLAGMGQKTRAALASGILRGSERVATLEPDEIVERAQGLHSLVKSAALVHGWADGASHSGPVLVNLDLRGLELPAQAEKACSGPFVIETDPVSDES